MPIYEYACGACGRTFEAFIFRKTDESEVQCPDCQNPRVERRLSVAAVGKGPTFGAAPRGGGCGPTG